MGHKKVKTSRRSFFKTAAALAGATVASTALLPFNGLVIAAGTGQKDKPWYGIGFDLEKCVGCGRCANACKEENNVPREPYFFRNWVEQYTVKNDGTVKIESPNGGIDGFKQSVPDDEIFKSFFVPKMCNHCAESPCVQVCPVGATFVSPEGVVLVDKNYCIGCRYCIQACPYGTRYINPETEVADKCTLCYHRITKGMVPACMEVCPTHARVYGDLHDKDSEIVQFIKTHRCQVLKPDMATGSKLYYNALSMEVR